MEPAHLGLLQVDRFCKPECIVEMTRLIEGSASASVPSSSVSVLILVVSGVTSIWDGCVCVCDRELMRDVDR